MKNRLLIAVAALTLSGCAGMSAAMQYSDVTLRDFDSGGNGWRIFDKPGEGRLMITTTYGRAVASGFRTGITFGLANNTDIPKSEYQSAVAAWLAQSGRHCAISDGYKLIPEQWEFKYRCQPETQAAVLAK